MIITTIAGHIGKDDAELRSTPQGNKVLNFSIAASDSNRGTVWFECAIWGKYGEVMAQYLTRGRAVTASGDLSTREWTDREGKNRTSLSLKVNSVAPQDSRSDDSQGEARSGGSNYGNRAGGGNWGGGRSGGGGGGGGY